MNKYLLLSMAFFLAGCPGPGDRFTSRTATTVVLKGNSVCALSIMKPGETLTAVEIYSSKDKPLFIRFYDKPLSVPQGRCLPLFGATFKSGNEYTVAWDIQTADGMYMIIAEFMLSND
ncbi:putative T6SS immunity periplasmic lipoprotein [Kosakonia cowanii]|uniref:putative T6SS immunity periplasmic lipoprotein n=1 Tax=Kosakonia cowanii TaxID=208223 RepID=UPI0012FE0723|nr:putative T6SS immunity periplasmic lipoprotein [Kosakonia cowanii]